ncbi:hypothetical protein [Sphingobium sp. EM0848]|uniref:hypothetical protein n=1 Tax=Sphingobium sp. EM0848 TaxID=2743473 RepID=UPI00159C4782|nr:hypothetical protein [Sphingobium sp. EM0848]
MRKFINHVDHIVWIVRPENQQLYVDKLSKLFRVTFEGPVLREEFGAQFWVSWESGLEIFAPHGDGDMAKMWLQRLEERGEGVLSMVFGVPDMEEACEHASQLGYQVSPVIGFGGNEPWKHKLPVFKEATVVDMLGTMMAFGEIGYADGVIAEE